MTSRCFFAALTAVAALVATSCSRADSGADNGAGNSSRAENAKAEAEINASLERLVAAVNAKDLNAIMAYYVPDDSLFTFDASPPRQYVGAAAWRKDWTDFLGFYPTTVHAEVSDWKIEADGNLAFGHGVFRTVGPDKNGKPLDRTFRVTDVYRKIDGKWLCVHEHLSFPVDLFSGKPDFDSKP